MRVLEIVICFCLSTPAYLMYQNSARMQVVATNRLRSAARFAGRNERAETVECDWTKQSDCSVLARTRNSAQIERPNSSAVFGPTARSMLAQGPRPWVCNRKTNCGLKVRANVLHCMCFHWGLQPAISGVPQTQGCEPYAPVSARGPRWRTVVRRLTPGTWVWTGLSAREQSCT